MYFSLILDDLSSPIKSSEPFYGLVLLFCELIRLNIFSYKAYLSTLIARGEIKQAIIPYLSFAQDELAGLEEVSRKRPAPQDQELSLSIPLPALRQPHLDIPGGGSGGGGTSEHSLERVSQSSLSGITSGPSSPGGGSFNTGMGNFKDITSSSHNQTKGDHLIFSLSTFFMEEEHLTDPTLDKNGSRHLIYAAYFPISCSSFRRQENNERSVVLCGVGRVRQKVEGIVKQISNEVEHCYCRLNGVQKPAIFEPRVKVVISKFQSLLSYEQHVIASACEELLREPLSRKNPYPSCSQLVFVCELLEICGAIHQLVTLLVDVVACDFPLPAGPKGDHRRGPPPPPCLPPELCMPLMCLIHSYLPCLLLSQHDTVVIFEK